MKILVTGAGGFVGKHLLELLKKKKGVKTHALSHSQVDIHKRSETDAIFKKIKPDWVFHLAGISFVPRTWDSPEDAYQTNVGGQLNVLESAKKYAPKARILITSSSEAYGAIRPSDVPINESTPLRPVTPYGVTKAVQDLMANPYIFKYDMQIIRTRAFNHIGPGQAEFYAASNFAKQIAEIERGFKEPVIHVGNLKAMRDFTDVRDIVKAYWLAIQKGVPGEVYNIGRGEGTSIEKLLRILLSKAQKEIKMVVDKKRVRSHDIPVHVADVTKFRKLTGWKPSIPLEKTLEDTLQDWRIRVVRPNAS